MKERVRWHIPDYVSRLVPKRKKWAYITLGGEDLFDIKTLLTGLKPPQYPSQIISVYYEPNERTEIVRAKKKKADLAAAQIQFTWHLQSSPRVVYGTVASLEAQDIDADLVVMFLDYEGTVLKFRREIFNCVANSVLCANDLLFVTSCVNEKFFEGNHHFRREAQTKVSEFLRVPYDQVTSEDVLKFHDFNVIRNQIRKASFSLKQRLDCHPIGRFVLYHDTIRMIFLPLQIVRERKMLKPKVELEILKP